jgi:hypothetical protein
MGRGVGMNAHTPGPWRVSDENKTIVRRDYTMIGDRSGELVASALAYPNSGFMPDYEAAMANARLIAAAPELLEALLAAVDEVNGTYPFVFLEDARAAIKKATGGT